MKQLFIQIGDSLQPLMQEGDVTMLYNFREMYGAQYIRFLYGHREYQTAMESVVQQDTMSGYEEMQGVVFFRPSIKIKKLFWHPERSFGIIVLFEYKKERKLYHGLINLSGIAHPLFNGKVIHVFRQDIYPPKEGAMHYILYSNGRMNERIKQGTCGIVLR